MPRVAHPGLFGPLLLLNYILPLRKPLDKVHVPSTLNLYVLVVLLHIRTSQPQEG